MLTVNASPQNGDKISSLYSNDKYPLSCAICCFQDTTRAVAGTTDYVDASYNKFGTTTEFNGYLVPEAFVGQFNELYNQDVGPSVKKAAYITATGAQQAIVRSRFILDIPLLAGRIPSECILITRFYSNASPTIGIIEQVNTGTTGTITVTLNFGVITTGNTKTQLGTSTQQVTLDGTLTTDTLYIKATNSTSVASGDRLYVEIILDTNQTARTAGTNPVGCGFFTGIINPSTASYISTIINFNIE